MNTINYPAVTLALLEETSKYRNKLHLDDDQPMPKLKWPESMLDWLVPFGFVIAIVIVALLTVASEKDSLAVRIALRVVAAVIFIGYTASLISIGVIGMKSGS